MFLGRKEGKSKSAEDYFLAGKSLPWWAIGASLIAANISAEQFIGMSGSGFALGLAIASYEWMAANNSIGCGKNSSSAFLLKKDHIQIPEFIEKDTVRILRQYWLFSGLLYSSL